LLKQIEESPPKPLPSGIDDTVGEVLLRMLEKDPERRFQTYDELLEALESLPRPLTEEAATRRSRRLIPASAALGRTVRPAHPAENRVLLVVDVQNDFCPGGALAVPGGDEIIPLINKLSRRFAHVILTQDWHCDDHLSYASSHPGRKPFEMTELSYGPQVLWPDHCTRGTPGADFHPALDVANCELTLRKGYMREVDSYSAFFENDRKTPTGLTGYLRERGLSRLFIAGLATDFCVAYTALDARRLGFEVTVIEEACRGLDVDGSLGQAWTQMERAGVVRA
jgi:nicotinamidase/pyrazinamidase